MQARAKLCAWLASRTTPTTGAQILRWLDSHAKRLSADERREAAGPVLLENARLRQLAQRRARRSQNDARKAQSTRGWIHADMRDVWRDVCDAAADELVMPSRDWVELAAEFTAESATIITERLISQKGCWRTLELAEVQTLAVQECFEFRDRWGRLPRSHDRLLGMGNVLVSGVSAWLVSQGGPSLLKLVLPDWYDEKLFRASVERLGAEYFATHGRYPTRLSGQCTHFDVLWSGVDQRSRQLLGCGTAKVFGCLQERTAVVPLAEKLRRIKKWHLEKGEWPSQGQSAEGRWLNDLRSRHKPDLEAADIPVAADRSQASRRRHGKEQFSLVGTLAQVAQRSRFERGQHLTACDTFNLAHDLSGRRIALLLSAAVSRPTASRSIASCPDLCQATSLSRLCAEIDAGCWDIDRRTHYLDWERPNADGTPRKHKWTAR